MSFVLDASVTMAWCFDDEQTPVSERALDLLLEQAAVVPPLWVYEVANVLAVAERRERLSAAEIAHFLDLLSQLPITVADDELDVDVLLDVARRRELSAYDAGYLALAAAHGLALATHDQDLAAAATAEGVPLVL